LVPVFEVGGLITPYELETLVGNAESFPRRSRLEVFVPEDVGAEVILTCREHLAALSARGILVSVRRGVPDRPRGKASASGWTPASAAERSWVMPTSAVVSATPERSSVLVAEDDPDMRRMLATLLRMAGHRVVEATDGADLLARLDPAD